MSPQRWMELMRRLGIGENLEMFKRVLDSYFEPHRHYHTGAHIDACLHAFDSARFLAESEGEVEAALWFHDMVYDPRASDNERASADIASQFLASEGLPSPACARVHALVIATMHDKEPTEQDSRLVVDIDLSILGQDPKVYDQFELAIREEYEWVPWPLYCQKRAEILRSFLDRKSIYLTEPLRERYEPPARINLECAISKLTNV